MHRKQHRDGLKANGHSLIGPLNLPATGRDWASFQETLHLRETIHDILGEFLSGHGLPFGWNQRPLTPWNDEMREGVWMPGVNVWETEDKVILEAFIPGVEKNNIEVQIKNGSVIVIRGERQNKKEMTDEGYLRRELRFRSFYRCFALPLEVQPDKVEACYENGILEIVLKKKEEAKTNSYKVPVR